MNIFSYISDELGKASVRLGTLSNLLFVVSAIFSVLASVAAAADGAATFFLTTFSPHLDLSQDHSFTLSIKQRAGIV